MKKSYTFFLGALYGVIMCYAVMITIQLRQQQDNSTVIKGNLIPAINTYVTNVNQGGCGYFAIKLYERLDTAKYSIVQIAGKYKHYAIYENETGFLIDANGYHHPLSFQLRGENKITPITKDSLRKLITIDSIWNKQFNRKDTIIINQFINQI